MNSYEKLRPQEHAELCDCKSIEGLLLVYTLGCNPIHCEACKGVVDPERIDLSQIQAESIFAWQRAFGSLYNLWLDSGEYESWAKAKMLDPNGQVNLLGVALAAELSRQLPTRYWWFHDEEESLPSACPSCGSTLSPSNQHGHLRCSQCPVLI